jgi:hypothetical protein
LRYAGLVEHVVKMRRAYKILVGKTLKGRDCLGDLSESADNIKMYLNVTGSNAVVFIHLTWVRVQ